MKNYIGISTSPHDTSLAIVDKYGQLVYAEAAERPLQSKRAWGNIPDHINYIEDLVVQYCDPDIDTVVSSTWSKHLVWGYSILLPILDYRIRKADQNRQKWETTYKYMGAAHKSVLNFSATGLQLAFGGTQSVIERRYYEHHYTHVATAAFSSPYDEAVCLVIDGFGETSSMAGFRYHNGKLRQIKSARAFPASLGAYYALMCDICGFNSLKGEEWKLMGLAAYGRFDQKVYDLIRPLLKVDDLRLRREKSAAKNIEALHRMRRKSNTSAMEYADFAATAQFVFTETVHQLLTNLHKLNISDNLILSGGCALNSSTNGTIIENTPFKELFVSSAPADDGNAIGAAYLAYYNDNPYVKRDGVLSPYLGSKIKNISLDRLRQYSGIRSEYLDDDVLVKSVAKALSEGKIVGWAQGKAEFGPRALGNRSILADPRKKGVKDRINAEVKFREEFRPFAPSILHEYGGEYFEHYQYSPYMERTLKFKDAVKEKVAGVVHVDGTGRLQSVTPEINPRYYNLIKAFYAITGVPILLNTSFNVMGKPIIHSVEDAVAVFQTSGLDILVIENIVFLKDNAYPLVTQKAHAGEVAEA